MLGSKHNHILWYLITFFAHLEFNLPIWSFFLADYLWFWFAQAATLWVISFVTSMIFEVPSGTRADLYGKKKVLLIGLFIQVCCTTTYLRADSYNIFVINELIRWLWSAMISWCLIPIVYDRYTANWKKNIFNDFSRNQSIMIFSGRVFASILAGYMFLYDPYLPYIGILIAMIIQLLITTQLVEIQNNSEASLMSTWSYIKKWFSDFMSADQGQLKRITLFFVWWFVFASILWFVYQPLFVSIWLEISSLWFLYAVWSLLSLSWSYMTKYIYKWDWRPTHIVKYFLLIITFTGLWLILLPGLRKLLSLIVIQASFGWFWPIMNTYINHSIWSEQRSTINSIVALISTADVLIGWILAWYLFELLWLGSVYLSLLIWWWVLLVWYIIVNKSEI